MLTYSSPELLDAEMRYRRERIARDWPTAADAHVSGSVAHRARGTISAVARLLPAPRRHRHA